MIVTERRLDLKLISPHALAEYMEHRGYTVRTLAQAVEKEVQRTHPHVTVSRATIGHLRTTGKANRRTVKPVVGRAIAKVLDCPARSLFVEELSSVQRETRRPEKVPA